MFRLQWHVDQPKFTIEYPSTSTVKPTVGDFSQLNQTCSPIPAKYEPKPSYLNGVTVFDTKLSKFGSVSGFSFDRFLGSVWTGAAVTDLSYRVLRTGDVEWCRARWLPLWAADQLLCATSGGCRGQCVDDGGRV